MDEDELEEAGISGINVTPLVDITLVLLIIFIVTAKITVSPGLPLDLPEAASGEGMQVVFAVSLPKEGGIFVDGEALLGEGALLERAALALKEEPELRAVIEADGAVPHQEVMRVMDILRQAKIHKIAFATKALLQGGEP